MPDQVIADKGFQGSGYVTPAKKPQDRELYTREHEYNNQVSSIRAPIERAVAHLKTWKILFTDYRRPLNLCFNLQVSVLPAWGLCKALLACSPACPL